MASAQVLSNSRKDHLEAGKKRLEEFRKKKAAEKAKKAISTSQLSSSDAGQNEKKSSESVRIGITDSDGAGTSSGLSGILTETSGLSTNNNGKAIEPLLKNDISASNDRPADSFVSANDDVWKSAVPLETTLINDDDVFGLARPESVEYTSHGKENYDLSNYAKLSESVGYDITSDQSMAFHPSATQVIDKNFDPSSYYGLNEETLNDDGSNLKDSFLMNVVNSDSLVTSVSPTNSGNFLKEEDSGYSKQLANGLVSSTYDDHIHHIGSITESPAQVWQSKGSLESNYSMIHDMWERKHNSFVSDMESKNSSSVSLPESRHTGFSLHSKSSINHLEPSPTLSGTNSKGSRPSFLDPIKVPRVASSSTPPFIAGTADSFSSRIHLEDSLPSFLNSKNSPVATDNGGGLFTNGIIESHVESKTDFYSRKQDEDFAALEQHIEDLTQEKFSLQRALEAARTLAESLAAENSALTDTYNQQGSIVNQLKSDMEKLQEEIKAHLVELESVKIEYGNAQLECNAADERAKLLASEVIGLEEKALQLRSNELKLERQLENLQAEITSLKKENSRLEKERQDLQESIDALQEEKKLFQSKLRKASASGKFVDTRENTANKQDVSTMTEDLVSKNDTDSIAEASYLEGHTSATLGGDGSSFPLLHDHRQFELEAISSAIPPDQMRTIQSINTLISELALEKEELMQALSAQSSESFKLKELNKELTQKLEVQTQRLELLTSQTMATDNLPARQPDTRSNMHDNAAYADEGDELVERVMGWVMKLFPRGQSRRRTNKLL